MALKLGKTKEEIQKLIEQRNNLLEQGDITSRYGELMINVTPDDFGKVSKGNIRAFDTIIDKAKDKIVELDIASLSESPKNHFSKVSGEKREEMIGSLKSYGQINPIIVRPKECVEHYKDLIENDFEILVGHTRVDCMAEIGAVTVKAIIVKCDDIEATLLINQSNIQREKVTDIELARAYKATYDALVQEKENNLTAGNTKNRNVEISTFVSKSQNETSKRTDEVVAEKYGISRATLQRKMALADCSDGIVKYYNRGKITQEEVQYLSKLPHEVQEQVYEILSKEENDMTKEIAQELLSTYKTVMKDPPLRASFSWNILREVIEKGQVPEVKSESKKERSAGKKKSAEIKKSKDGIYRIPDECFPENLKAADKNEYVKAALKYILDQQIEVNLAYEKTIES